MAPRGSELCYFWEKTSLFPVALNKINDLLWNRPGNSSENPPIRLPLSDGGEGGSDMTSQDGIYSAFLPYPSTSKGYYAIEILATNNELTRIAVKSDQLGKYKNEPRKIYETCLLKRLFEFSFYNYFKNTKIVLIIIFSKK